MSFRGPRDVKCWTWSDWTIGDLHLEYGTLTLEARGHAHFAGVTSTNRADGPDHWWAGFSLETREGVRLHVEPPHQGAPMGGAPGARHRWSFDFTYEASTFTRIVRVVQNAARWRSLPEAPPSVSN
jgi:hypothetical protein